MGIMEREKHVFKWRWCRSMFRGFKEALTTIPVEEKSTDGNNGEGETCL